MSPLIREEILCPLCPDWRPSEAYDYVTEFRRHLSYKHGILYLSLVRGKEERDQTIIKYAMWEAFHRRKKKES